MEASLGDYDGSGWPQVDLALYSDEDLDGGELPDPPSEAAPAVEVGGELLAPGEVAVVAVDEGPRPPAAPARTVLRNALAAAREFLEMRCSALAAAIPVCDAEAEVAPALGDDDEDLFGFGAHGDDEADVEPDAAAVEGELQLALAAVGAVLSANDVVAEERSTVFDAEFQAATTHCLDHTIGSIQASKTLEALQLSMSRKRLTNTSGGWRWLLSCMNATGHAAP